MTENSKRKSIVPSELGLKENGGVVLLGSRCPQCHRTFFPQREWCGVCLEPICQEVELSPEGSLVSFSLVETRQAYSLVQPPYVIGEIALADGTSIFSTIGLVSETTPEGVKLSSSINRDNLDSLKIGQRVVLKPVVVKKDEEGNDVIAYNFGIEEVER